MTAPSPTEEDCFTVLRSFLLAILPSGTEVFRGQVNRVSEPHADDFVVMWPLRLPRLATNIDGSADVKFTGSINGTALTVSVVAQGSIAVPSQVFGAGVSDNTTITTQNSGSPGGAGTYTVAPSQTVNSETMSAGGSNLTQETEWVVQLDVHGPNSADNAQTISTLFRDDYAVEAFAALNAALSPFHADDPKQVPFINDQSQYENRWIVEAHMQVNTSLRVSQQYADALTVGIKNVESSYPP